MTTGFLDKIKEKIGGKTESDDFTVEPFTFKQQEESPVTEKNKNPLDEWHPTLSKKGTSEHVVIPKQWIRLTELKEALKHKKLSMQLVKAPDDPVWGYRIILGIMDPRNQDQQEEQEQ